VVLLAGFDPDAGIAGEELARRGPQRPCRTLFPRELRRGIARLGNGGVGVIVDRMKKCPFCA
jgi:hypothetical protein